MESDTETVAKRARVGARTPVLRTMKKLFWRILLLTSGLGSPIIDLDKI